MHWLPLVAMVIASALPFPYNPVTRIVAATTEETGGGSRSSEDGSGGGGGQHPPPPPAQAPPLQAPARNCSHGDAASSRPTAPQEDPCGEPHGTPGELRTGEPDDRRSAGGTAAAAGVSAPPRDVDDTGAGNLSCHGDGGCGVSMAAPAVTQDYSGQGDGDSTEPKGKLRVSGDEREIIAGNGDRSPSPVPAPGPAVPRGTRSPNASRQKPGVLDTRVNAETGAGSPVRSAATVADTDDGGMMAMMMMMDVTDGIPEVDELFLDVHPRVLFSPSSSPPLHPPLLLMLESGALPEAVAGGAAGGGAVEQETDDGEGHAHRRIRRADLSDLRRGERSVCESESMWVTDKKTAVDNHGRTVTILPVIQTPTGPLKQYFFETRCRRGEHTLRGSYRGAAGAAAAGASTSSQGLGLGVAGSGCLGVDKKQWKSECKAKHSFVRALAKDANNRMGWRWIRIDSSCVCVLLARVNRQSLGKV